MTLDYGSIDVEVTYFRSNQDFIENPELPMTIVQSFNFPRGTNLADVKAKIAYTFKQRQDESECRFTYNTLITNWYNYWSFRNQIVL